MRILIASDVHGSKPCAERILNIFEQKHADLLVLLGDLYYHGPRNPLCEGYSPMEVSELLNEYKDKLLVIRGNCDAEVDEMISDFPFFDTKTIVADGTELTFTHGHKYNIDNMPKKCGKVLFYGHTHKSFVGTKDGVTVVNIGSASLPKQDNPATLALFNNGIISLENLQGDELAKIDTEV